MIKIAAHTTHQSNPVLRGIISVLEFDGEFSCKLCWKLEQLFIQCNDCRQEIHKEMYSSLSPFKNQLTFERNIIKRDEMYIRVCFHPQFNSFKYTFFPLYYYRSLGNLSQVLSAGIERCGSDERELSLSHQVSISFPALPDSPDNLQGLYQIIIIQVLFFCFCDVFLFFSSRNHVTANQQCACSGYWYQEGFNSGIENYTQNVASDQGLHCLLTEIFIQNRIKMKKYTRHP